MARESQGIQIALIVFVMLSIVLGVTTYLYVQRNGEVLKAQQTADRQASDAKTALAAKEAEVVDLKRMLGGPDGEKMSTADLKTASIDDMKKYGADVPEDLRFYRKIVERLYDTVNKQAGNLASSAAAFTDLQKTFADRKKAGDVQIAEIQSHFDKVKDDLKTASGDYADQEKAREADKTLLVKQIKDIKSTSLQAVQVAKDDLKKHVDAEVTMRKEVKEAYDKLNGVNKATMDVPCGEITWVNQRSGTVWINRGRDDHLERQTQFGVYSGETGEMSKVKKATVEVIRVVDDHTSEARIIDDKVADPILPGDKVYTPLWTPGSQTHYALAGIMDLDGDGRNSVATVRALITSNGGIVDCDMDSDGNVSGAVQGSTRIIVLGDAPDNRNTPKLVKAYGDIVGQAEHVSARKMTLSDLKEKLGYKKASSIEHFGNPAGPGDIGKAAAALKKNRPAPKDKDKDKAASGDNP